MKKKQRIRELKDCIDGLEYRIQLLEQKFVNPYPYYPTYPSFPYYPIVTYKTGTGTGNSGVSTVAGNY